MDGVLSGGLLTRCCFGVSFGACSWPPDGIASELKLLCSQAADIGARIALEPQAMANIRSPQDAMEIIEKADHPGLN